MKTLSETIAWALGAQYPASLKKTGGELKPAPTGVSQQISHRLKKLQIHDNIPVPPSSIMARRFFPSIHQERGDNGVQETEGQGNG